MEQRPEISVIVPIYGVEQYLPQCIDSILMQTFYDFELLLIDDGSPDRSGDICDDYARTDQRIRVFHQKNAGLSCARNVGLINSCGRYVTFIDSDDYVKPCYLEELYGALPADKNVKGVIVGGLDKFLPNGNMHTIHVPEQKITSEKMYLILTELIDKYVTYAGSKLYDNCLIKQYKVSFVPFVSGLEDLLFMLDYLIYSDFILICDYNNYIYRVGHSADALSVRINSFHAEYAAFSNFLKRVYAYQHKYALTDDMLRKTWSSLTIFFHKIILAIYKLENNYSRTERLHFLHLVLLSEKEWVRKYFSPQYKADVFGKFLFCHVGIWAFDMWMRFLLNIKFRKMFGAKY